MLLSVSFAWKDGMLDWERPGIDFVEWPPQKLEIHSIEHLAFASYMGPTMDEWLKAPWFTRYATFRNTVILDWSAQHTCPMCGAGGRNKKSIKNTWSFMTGAMQHFVTSASCLGSVLNGTSPDIHLIPSTLELLLEKFPGECSRTFSLLPL